MTSEELTGTLGKRLHAARLARGLVLEDVNFKTHIPVARLAELENDDFSNFANLTYAKGFLKLYANFLDLDARSYLEQFDTDELARVNGAAFVQQGGLQKAISMPLGYEPISPRRDGNTLLRWWPVAGVAVLAAVLFPVLYAIGDDSMAKPAPRNAEAAPKPTKGPELAAVETPSTNELKPADAPKSASPVPPKSEPTPKPKIEIKAAVSKAKLVIEDDVPTSATPAVAAPAPVEAPHPPLEEEVGGFRGRIE